MWSRTCVEICYWFFSELIRIPNDGRPMVVRRHQSRTRIDGVSIRTELISSIIKMSAFIKHSVEGAFFHDGAAIKVAYT